MLLLYLYECYTNKDSHTTNFCVPHTSFERRVTRHARDYVPLIQSTSDRSTQLRDHLTVRVSMENNSVPQECMIGQSFIPNAMAEICRSVGRSGDLETDLKSNIPEGYEFYTQIRCQGMLQRE